MRERTPFPGAVIERLPGLRLIVTTGRANASIDLEAARARGITVCGTESLASAPAELTWALILGLARHLPTEGDNLRSGRWQSTVGLGLAGRTLGVIGLGRIGSRVAGVGAAFGMEVVAWSRHLTAERAEPLGATAVDLDDLLRRSDVVTLHLPLKPETRALLDAGRIALMKPTALLVNTSRAGLLDVDAAVHAVNRGSAGRARPRRVRPGAAAGATTRSARPTGVLATPHLGYVADDVYALFFRQVVEDIVAFAAGEPVRVLG